MKQNSLQQLLAKYQEGTINEEELEQLNILTHRDEVISEAESRARVIVRHRTQRNIGFAVVGVALLGIGTWILAPKTENPVLIAELNAPENVQQGYVNQNQQDEAVVTSQPSGTTSVAKGTIEQSDNTASIVQDEAVPAIITPVNQDLAQDDVAAEDLLDNTEHIERVIEPQTDPVVVCNSQCDADSVISEIRKFLSV